MTPRSERKRHDIHLRCLCGKELRAPARLAGQQALCPRCGIELTVMPTFDDVTALLAERAAAPRGSRRMRLYGRQALLGLWSLAACIVLADQAAAIPPAFDSTQTIYANSVQIRLDYRLPGIQLYALPYGLSSKQRWRNSLRKQHAAAANAAKARPFDAFAPAADPPQAGLAGLTEDTVLREAVHAWAAGRDRTLGPRARQLLHREAKACSLTIEEYVQLYLETEARVQGTP